MAVDCPIETGNNAGLLVDYCAGRLDSGAAAGFEEHLAACEACRERVAAQKAVWRALDGWEPEPVSPGFDAALRARIDSERRGAWWQALGSWIPRLGFQPALTLALASMVILAVALMRPQRTPAPAPEPGQTVEALDADRLERALDDVDMLRQLSPAPGPETM
jgi:anti-sigma factor RsiW